MKTFKQYISESIKKLPWDSDPSIGWWDDHSRKTITLYHGTHIRNLESVTKNGLNRPDPQTGMISLTADPNTAFGYAAMSGVGGEAEFRKAGAKVTNTPPNERAIFVIELPYSWFRDHLDPNLGGNLSTEKKKLMNKSSYEAAKKQNVADDTYYQLTEFRIKTTIPSRFIKGYMIK